MLKLITNFLFGKPTVESIVAPLSKMQDQLDELVFDNAVEESKNNVVMQELAERNLELANSTADAIKKSDKFRELLG